MKPDYSLRFSDNSGVHSFQLKKIDQKSDQLPVNVITIDNINYKVKASDRAIALLKTHISAEDDFVSFHKFTGSLHEDLGLKKNESIVFKNIITSSLAPTKTEATAIKAIQLQIEKLSKENKFSGTVLIAKTNSPNLIEAYVGFRNIETKKVINSDTQFNIASMTKMFTTVGILQLMEEGKLSLDDPIGDYLPTEITNDNMKKVTIRQLLTHTGGTGAIKGDYWEISNPKDFIKVTKDNEPDNPGIKCSYSNLGFVLLGAIIENVSNMDYYQYIQKNVFNEAAMNNSNYQLKTDQSPNTAIGYMGKNNELSVNHKFLPLRGTPAGCSYSTGRDLLAFSEALQNETLLKKSSTRELIKTFVTETSDAHPTNHSIGFMTGDGWYGHTGHYDGANGELRIYPKSGYTVIVLANRDQSQASKLADFIDNALPLDL